MKISLATKQLQNLVAKVIKCASNDKTTPITNFMEIKVADGTLSFLTTDAVNYLRMSQEIESKENFSVVVEAESFAKLISKMTSENITFEVSKDALTVTGGKSKYKIELVLDVDGTVLKEIPKPNTDGFSVIKPEVIKVSFINSMIASAKSALSTDPQNDPILRAYYVGDAVISTDGDKMCYIKEKFTDKPLLIHGQTADLIQLMPEDGETEIAFYQNGDDIAFKTKFGLLVTKAFNDVTVFPVEALDNWAKIQFSNTAEVRKDDLLQALDRISCFVSPYDKNEIHMTFGNGILVLQNKKDVGEEEIECISGSEEDFECTIKVESLKSQIRVISTDNVFIQYGVEKCIKIVDGDTLQVISLVVEGE